MGSVTYVVPIVDFDSQAGGGAIPVDNLTITVCPSVTCITNAYRWTNGVGGAVNPDDGGIIPLDASASPISISHPAGLPPFVYAITVPYGLNNASLRLEAPGYAEMDYYFGGPLVGKPEGGPDGGTAGAYTVTGLAIPVLRQQTRTLLYNQIGIPGDPDPTRGVLAVRTLNCLRDRPASEGGGANGTRAPMVKLQPVGWVPDPASRAWTLSFQNLPRGSPDVTTLATDPRGVIGFINVPPVNYPVHGLAPVDSGMAYGETNVFVRPDVISLAEIRDGIDVWGQ